MRRMVRGAWVTAVLLAAAEACSSGGPAGYEEMTDSGGAPHYDGSTSQDSAGDTASGAEAGSDAAPGGGSDAAGGNDAAEASSTEDAGDAGSKPEASPEAASEPETGPETSVAEAGPEPTVEAAVEASVEAAVEASVEASVEAAVEAASEASVDAAPESSSTQEAGSDAGEDAHDAGQEAATIVPPVCDGVVSAAEYGGNDDVGSSGGQTWYVTWDDTNLYIGLANASIYEGMVLYVAIAPGTDAGPAGQLTVGQTYDYTLASTLPFSADLVVYAKDGYTEARTPWGVWWVSPNQTAVVQCDDGTTEVREEVIPWSLVGGRPAAFGWLGYVAAGGNTNGFIYGQIPTGNPTGTPANDATFTQYYDVTSAAATPMPFADLQ